MDIIDKHSDYTMQNDAQEHSQADVEKTLGLMQEFNNARQIRFSVEESRKRTLSFVDDLWHE